MYCVLTAGFINNKYIKYIKWVLDYFYARSSSVTFGLYLMWMLFSRPPTKKRNSKSIYYELTSEYNCCSRVTWPCLSVISYRCRVSLSATEILDVIYPVVIATTNTQTVLYCTEPNVHCTNCMLQLIHDETLSVVTKMPFSRRAWPVMPMNIHECWVVGR